MLSVDEMRAIHVPRGSDQGIEHQSADSMRNQVSFFAFNVINDGGHHRVGCEPNDPRNVAAVVLDPRESQLFPFPTTTGVLTVFLNEKEISDVNRKGEKRSF